MQASMPLDFTNCIRAFLTKCPGEDIKHFLISGE